MYKWGEGEGEGGEGGRGIQRWGVEGIRIGTSDRFGRGRGEFRELLKSYKPQTQSSWTLNIVQPLERALSEEWASEIFGNVKRKAWFRV